MASIERGATVRILPFSSKQSSIFALSAEKSKILRTFGTFVRFKGNAESQVQPSAARLGSILSGENRAGAILPSHAIVAEIAFAGTSPMLQRDSRKLESPAGKLPKFEET